jgi:hypothetical protein
MHAQINCGVYVDLKPRKGDGLIKEENEFATGQRNAMSLI